jgi:putative hemolysin
MNTFEMKLELMDMKIKQAKLENDEDKVKSLNKERKEICIQEDKDAHNRGLDNLASLYRDKAEKASSTASQAYSRWAHELDNQLRW